MVGIKPDEMDSIFHIVAGLLHLGNVEFQVDPSDEDKSVVSRSS